MSIAYEQGAGPVCDLCGLGNFTLVYEGLVDTALPLPGEFEIRTCNDCGLVRRTPEMSDEAIAPYYPHEYVPYAAEKKWVQVLKKVFWSGDRNLIRRLAPSDGVVFEIGSAGGEFLDFLGSDYSRYGMDMDTECVKRGKEKYGLNLFSGNCETISVESMELPPVNLILMSYVLEHLHSPKRMLEKIHRLLAPQGVAVIKIPNYTSFERMFFGRYWHSLDIPRHVHIFTRESMRSYARKTGFVLEETHFSLVPNDWIESIARFLRVHRLGLIAYFFNYKNPLLVALFLPLSIAGKFFGRSPRMTCVLRKVA